jgi:hypothetical protein
MLLVDRSHMRYIRASADLPAGFTYPADFLKYVREHDGFPISLSPWTIQSDWASVEDRISRHCGFPVVIFGFAQLEDIVACFGLHASGAIQVVVVAPFIDRQDEGVWYQDKCVVHAELESFGAWLRWTEDNQTVLLDRDPPK